ncbi:MAG: ABC transporter [Micrococcales bacterium]|nr:MAG: ABC transporter [Micrococcales bacterium]PIE27282.1 MAG: ABC transporter [Micrococcales bacterium]
MSEHADRTSSVDADAAGTGLSLQPAGFAGNAAPAARRVRAQIGWDVRTLLGNGEQLLLSLVLPVLALVALTLTRSITVPVPDGLNRVDVVTPGVMALAIISTSFTGQAITTAFDRRRAVLRLLSTTPLGSSGLLLGRIGAVLLIQVLQLILLGGVAMFLGWSPTWGSAWLGLLTVALGTACFTGLGMLLGGTTKAEIVLALANLAWVLFAAFGVLLPPGDGLDRLALWLPSGALADLMRAGLAGTGHPVRSSLVLLGWSVAVVGAAVRLFRWDE